MAAVVILAVLLVKYRNDTFGVVQPCITPSIRTPLSQRPTRGGAKITSPENCVRDLPLIADIYGTYTSDTEDKNLWVLVYADGYYWPQGIAGCQKPQPFFNDEYNGSWHSQLILATSGKNYDIVLAMTDVDNNADKLFRNWFTGGCEKGNFPGIAFAELPEDLVELDVISVSTR